METPVLSKKQLKSTLSAKKNRPKETIKNVLAMPYKNYVWADLSEDVQAEFLEVFKAHAPLVKSKKVNTPWNILKKIPKAERKAYRLEYSQKANSDQPQASKDESVGISFGINAVSKMLEKNSVRAILVSANDDHRSLVQHIVDLAVLYKVPILRINNLAKTVKSTTGISAVCLSFNEDLHVDSKCNLIIEKIENIFKNLPPLENHINFTRSIDSLQMQIDPEHQEEKIENVKVDEVQIRNEVYLKRINKNCRAFIPPSEEKEIKKENVSVETHDSTFIPFTEEPELKKNLSMEVDESGFVPFTEESGSKLQVVKSENNSNARQQYKSLIVKRLKGDKNRNQKKIQNLKRKRQQK